MTVQHINEITSKHFGLGVYDLTARCKSERIMPARHAAMRIMADDLGMGCVAIGRVFGRHYSTVISNLQTSANMLTYDKQFQRDLNEIRKKL